MLGLIGHLDALLVLVVALFAFITRDGRLMVYSALGAAAWLVITFSNL